MKPTRLNSLFRVLLALVLLSLAVTSCLNPSNQTATPSVYPTETPKPLPQAMVTLRVKLPAPLGPGESVSLNVLDEVTGLALNSKSYPMQAVDAQNLYVILPFVLNSVIKYRYTRQGKTLAQEHLSDGRPVRYRLYYVGGPGTVDDVISRWTDTTFTGPTGRISGVITDAKTGAPVPGLLVEAGGAQTLTAADGSYLLEGLPPGNHNLVFYALDGAYAPFEQGAVVAADATTPASLRLSQAARVKIVFTLSVPKNSPPNVPVRMAGNLWQTGNTYADLSGGTSSLASSMPVLAPLPDGRYSITLDLPAGADLLYKYTLGDGFWNAEHNPKGEYLLRELIGPASSGLQEDSVAAWSDGKSAPITFNIDVPSYTPADEWVSIQFNPSFGWMGPIPMWKIGDHHWAYVLYSPLNTVGQIGYRYCRNDLCGVADSTLTSGPNAAGKWVTPSLLPETIDAPVPSWTWLVPNPGQTTVPNVAVKPRSSGFIAGVQFQSSFQPTWMTHISTAMIDTRSLSANWVFLAPTWTFTRANLPVLEALPSQDPLWQDMLNIIGQANAQTLKVGLFPTPNFPGGADAWWKSGTRDFAWWNVWFERYRAFLMNNADLAAQQNAPALVLGGEWLAPALPNGVLSDGSPSNVPADAEQRWRSLISDVRSRYKGILMWALPYSAQNLQKPLSFLSEVDEIYVLWNAPLSGNSEAEMVAKAGQLLDNQLKPFQLLVGKPVVLALAYPAVKGGVAASRDLVSIGQPGAGSPDSGLDLQDQVQAYNAMLLAVNDRDWISGVVSWGYYPPATLQDESASVHGKPARGVLWYWFPRMLGLPTQ